MCVRTISDERRNFSVSVKIYWLKRRIFSVPLVGEIKFEIYNSVLLYRFRRMDEILYRTDKILRLCENIFTKKENFVHSSESIPQKTITNFKFNFAHQQKTVIVPMNGQHSAFQWIYFHINKEFRPFIIRISKIDYNRLLFH